MKKYAVELTWGVIFIFVLLIWMFGEKAFGLHSANIEDHSFYTGFFAAVALAIYALAIWEKRRQYYHGKMTWKQGFLTGFIMTLVIVILTPAAQFVISRYISPEYFRNMINYSVETNRMSRQEAEAYFSLKNYILQSTAWAFMSGTVTSALVALLLRKK